MASGERLFSTDDYSFRELLRQFRTGAPSIQLKRLGEFTPINAAVSLSLTILILLFVESQIATPWMYLWAIVQVVFMFGTLVYLRRRKRTGNPVPDSHELSSIGVPVILAAVSGGLWGLLTAFIPVVPAHLQTALILVMLGMAAGGSVTLAPVQQAAIAFVLGCALPATVYHLTLADRTSTMLALMMVVYATAMIGTSRVFNRALWRQVRAEEQAREIQEASLHQRIANLVNESESVNDALQSCLDEVCRYTGWPVAHVLVAADDESGEFVSSGVIYVADEKRYAEIRDLSLNLRIKPGQGLSGQVLEMSRPVWTAAGEPNADLPLTFDNSVTIPKFERSGAVLRAGLRAYLGFPVIIGQQLAAVLEFASNNTTRPSRDLMSLLSTIATELGRAIERQRSRTSLQQSEHKFRSLIESSAQGMAVSLDGKFLYVNEVGARSFGYTVDEFLAMDSVFDIVHPDFVEAMAMLGERRRSGEEATDNFEFTGIHKDGHFITLAARSSVIDWQGQTALMTTTIDVTKRKAAEQSARREERRAKDYLNITGSIIYAMDTDANLTLLNRTGCQLLECNESDVIGKNAFDLFVPEQQREQSKAVYAHWMKGEKEILSTFVGRLNALSGSTRDIRWQLVALRDEHGEISGVLGAGLDMTEQQRIEAQLQQAQKMEAVGQLTSGIAHDFNNILAVVMGNLEMAIELGSGDEELLSAAMEGAQRGADLNRQLLTFSKKQIVDAKTVDINEIIGGMSGLLKRALGEDTKIITALHGSACYSKIDSAQLESAILNLALNSREATLGGGEILVETGIASRDDLPEDFERNGHDVYVRVRDTGIGMEPKVRERAIEPFFTTKEAGGGSGLGLSMVFNFVQSSGGQLKIFSEPDKGTDVLIFLRGERPEGEESPAGAKTAAADENGQYKILVVEDQTEVSKMICHYLESLGHQAEICTNGEDAMRMIETNSGDIDVVLSDVVLPGGIKGTEVVDFVGRSYPGIKTVLMSGNLDKSNRDDRDELPDIPFLRKPFKRSELEQALQEVFARGTSA